MLDFRLPTVSLATVATLSESPESLGRRDSVDMHGCIDSVDRWDGVVDPEALDSGPGSDPIVQSRSAVGSDGREP